MYEITVEGRFTAAHRHRMPGGIAPLHGHDFLVLVRVAGTTLADDVLVDFHEVEVDLKWTLAEIGHQDLTEHADFQGREATPAALARWIYERMARRLTPASGTRLASVEVRDTERTGARYSSPDS